MPEDYEGVGSMSDFAIELGEVRERVLLLAPVLLAVCDVTGDLDAALVLFSYREFLTRPNFDSAMALLYAYDDWLFSAGLPAWSQSGGYIF